MRKINFINVFKKIIDNAWADEIKERKQHYKKYIKPLLNK